MASGDEPSGHVVVCEVGGGGARFVGGCSMVPVAPFGGGDGGVPWVTGGHTPLASGDEPSGHTLGGARFVGG